MSDSFGLELVLSTLPGVSSGDVVTAILHWSVISRGHLCVGVGDKWEDLTRGTELLPEGWNQDQSVYTLKYADTKGDNKILLKVLAAGDILICSLLRVADNKSSDVTISPEEFINIEAKYPELFKNKAALLELIQKELWKPLDPGASQKEKSQDDKKSNTQGEKRPDHDPLRDPRGGGRRMDPRYDPVGPSFPGRGRGGGMGGPSRNFGDEMGPPGWDNMYM